MPCPKRSRRFFPRRFTKPSRWNAKPEAEKFLNAVVEIGYAGSSLALLDALQKIESALGRTPERARNHSRTIDLDLLYHGGAATR